MDGASYMDLNVKSLRDEFIELDEDIVREVLRSANQDCEIARDKLFELAGRKRPKPEVSRSIETGFSLEEHKGDMFAFAAANTCLAHCVSVDMAMGKGIAIEFKKRFGGVDELKKQGTMIGGVAVLKRNDRFVYYLVTKEKYWNKPTLQALESSVKQMLKHMIDNKVARIAMPRIGCGLDGLNWEKGVRPVIEKLFRETNIKVDIYSL